MDIDAHNEQKQLTAARYLAVRIGIPDPENKQGSQYSDGQADAQMDSARLQSVAPKIRCNQQHIYSMLNFG